MNFHSIISFFRITAEEMSSVITGGAPAETAAAEETAAALGEAVGTASPAPEVMGFLGGGILPTVLIYAVMFGALYLLFFRPNRKREKQLLEMRQGIKAGDNIVTNSGLYGKVTDVGDDVFVVEFGTNRGVRIPVSKTEVVGIKTPKLSPTLLTGDSASEQGKK